MVATGGLGGKAVSDKGKLSSSFESAAGDLWNSKLVVGCSVSMCERDQVGRLAIWLRLQGYTRDVGTFNHLFIDTDNCCHKRIVATMASI